MSTLRALALTLLFIACVGGETTRGPSEMVEPNPPGIPTPDAIVAIDLGVDSMVIYSPNFYMQRLGVHGVTRAGDRVNLHGVRWQSSDPAVVRVDSADGTLVVLTVGRARVTVTWQGLTDSAELIAERLCRGAAAFPVGPARLRVGEQAQWTAKVNTCFDEPGIVRFSSHDTTVLAMSPEGLGTARRVGVAIVMATLISGPVNSTTAMTVTVDP